MNKACARASTKKEVSLSLLIVFSIISSFLVVLNPGFAVDGDSGTTVTDSDLELVDVGPYNGVNIPTDYQVDKDWSSFIVSEDKSCAPYVDLNGVDREVEAVECRGEYPVIIPKVSGEAVDTISNDTETWTLTKISDGGERSGSCTAEQLSKYPFWDCTSNDGIVLLNRNVQYKLTLEFKAGPARDVDFSNSFENRWTFDELGACQSAVLPTSIGFDECTVSIPENKAGIVSFVMSYSESNLSLARFFYEFSPKINIPYLDPLGTKYLKTDPVTVIFRASKQVAIDYKRDVPTFKYTGLKSEKVPVGSSLLTTPSVNVYSPNPGRRSALSLSAVKSVDIVPTVKIPAGTSWSYWRSPFCRDYNDNLCRTPPGKVDYDSAVRVFDNGNTLSSSFGSYMRLNVPYNLDWDQEVLYSFRAENIEYYKVFYSDEDDPSDNEITLKLYTGPKPYEYSTYSYTCKPIQVPNYSGSFMNAQNSSITDLTTGENLGWKDSDKYGLRPVLTADTLLKFEASAHFDAPSRDSDGWVYVALPKQSDGSFPDVQFSTEGWVKKWVDNSGSGVNVIDHDPSQPRNVTDPMYKAYYPAYGKKLTGAEDVSVTVVSSKNYFEYLNGGNFFVNNIKFFVPESGRYNLSHSENSDYTGCQQRVLLYNKNLIHGRYRTSAKIQDEVKFKIYPYSKTNFIYNDRDGTEWRIKEASYSLVNEKPGSFRLDSAGLSSGSEYLKKTDNNHYYFKYSGTNFNDALPIESLYPTVDGVVLVGSLKSDANPHISFKTDKLVLINNLGDEIEANLVSRISMEFNAYKAEISVSKGVAHLSQAVGNSVAEKDKPITFGFQTLSADVYSDTSERKYTNMVLLPFKDDSALIESVRLRMGTMDVPVQNYSGTYRLASEPVINSGRPNTVYYTFDNPTTLDERDYRWLTKAEAAAENLDWRDATAFKVVYDEENIDALKGIFADGTVTILPTGNSVGDRYNLWVGPPNTVGDESTFNRQVSPPATGVVVTQSVSGKVWWDNNADGVVTSNQQNPRDNEQGISGVKVDLLKMNDGVWGVVDSSVSDSNGDYSFSNVDSGSYRVRVKQSSEPGDVPLYVSDSQMLTVTRTHTHGVEGTSSLPDYSTVDGTLGNDLSGVNFGFSAHPEGSDVTHGTTPGLDKELKALPDTGSYVIVAAGLAVIALFAVGFVTLARSNKD